MGIRQTPLSTTRAPSIVGSRHKKVTSPERRRPHRDRGHCARTRIKQTHDESSLDRRLTAQENDQSRDEKVHLGQWPLCADAHQARRAQSMQSGAIIKKNCKPAAERSDESPLNRCGLNFPMTGSPIKAPTSAEESRSRMPTATLQTLRTQSSAHLRRRPLAHKALGRSKLSSPVTELR